MKYFLSALCLLLSGPALAAGQPPATCLSPAELTNKITPPTFFSSMSACVNEGKYEEGLMLYGIGNIYLKYDLAYLDDPLAPARASDLVTQGFVNIKESQQEKFQVLMDERLNQNEEILSLCSKALKMGPPAYGSPSYLAAEGSDIESVLMKHVDGHNAWVAALEGGVGCPINGL